jgi:hypothetical protein
LLAALALAAATPAFAQQAATAPQWKVAGERLLFEAPGFSAPLSAGGVTHYETKELHGGLDTILLYRTPDQEVLASLYVYLPSISHPGIQLVSTENAIEAASNGAATKLGITRERVGEVAGAALAAEYRGYLGKLHSRAAFIKVGRWMVKVRVSGPEARAGEVAAAMAALLAGLRFEGKAQPRPVETLDIGSCPATEEKEAKLVGDAATDLEAAIGATFDATGMEVSGPRAEKRPAVLGRIGRRWCRSDLEVGESRVPVLRSLDSDRRDDGARAMLLALYSDAGGMIEIMRLPKDRRHVLLRHGIGMVEVLGTFDAMPSLAQVRELFRDPGEAGKVHARVSLKANGNTEIEVAGAKGPQT